MEGNNVLILDDEESILKAIKRILVRQGLKVVTFLDPHEALDHLKENSVEVILSDMRMPIMTGAEFLEQAKALRPLATRIVLSGFSERESLMKAINQGHIWRFMAKPWDNADLLQTIKNAQDVHYAAGLQEKLIRHLETQKAELKDLNEKLESIVEERTKELQVRSEILEMAINCSPEVDVKTLETLDSLTGHPGHQFATKGSTGRPIRKGRDVLGHLLIPEGAKEMEEFYQRFDPLLAMVLSNSRTASIDEDLLREVDGWLDDKS
jgi:response regulator RpfG family c-di-GMP phosphodiesterase